MKQKKQDKTKKVEAKKHQKVGAIKFHFKII